MAGIPDNTEKPTPFRVFWKRSGSVIWSGAELEHYGFSHLKGLCSYSNRTKKESWHLNFLSIAVVKHTDQSNLGSIYLAHLPSQQGRHSSGDCSLKKRPQIPASFLHSYTLQDPLSSDWCHPQWVSLPTSIAAVKIMPIGMHCGLSPKWL